ncbi:MAG TPA: lipid-A-disaccharide synthase [Candidatus Binataceae bacterium]|jgi:lipid-A-disaccharide synthase|nr:lipid-A-disaccharide synthase [Candidatus Binataceae bacterium]
MIVAGEASGDMHGADLVREILACDPSCEFFGIAGQYMRSAGVRALFRAEDVAGLGLMELASTIQRTVGAMLKLRAILRREKPDLLILIDFAEFNMMLARAGKNAGVPVLYYITPQVWAWRRGRVDKLVQRADRLAVVLPFEAQLFSRAGERAAFVGHPLLDKVKVSQGRDETLQRHRIAPDARLLALLPGSRRREIRYLLPPMLEAARILKRDHQLTPCLALAHTLEAGELSAVSGVNLDGIHIIQNDTYSIVGASDVALVASGTATLETALLGCPMVIAYKMAAATYLVARILVTGVNFIGMPNILAGTEIVPELIQHEATGPRLASAAAALLRQPLRGRTIEALNRIRSQLGAPGAAARVAAMALAMIE